MKKTRKLMSVILTVFLLFSSISFAFAADASTVENDIAYIKENGNGYLRDRCEAFEERLKLYATDEEKYKDDIDYIYSEVDEMIARLQDCAKGNHNLSYLMSDCYPHPCTARVFCAYCTYHVNNAKLQTKHANHIDKDKNDVCDACDLELHYQECSHICHNDSFIVSKIIMPILMWIWDELDIEEFCECGMYQGHYLSFI